MLIDLEAVLRFDIGEVLVSVSVGPHSTSNCSLNVHQIWLKKVGKRQINECTDKKWNITSHDVQQERLDCKRLTAGKVAVVALPVNKSCSDCIVDYGEYWYKCTQKNCRC